MKIFPIGTSRLHEPLTLIDETLVEFPRMGYFHSTSQILDCLKIITGDITLTAEQAKLVIPPFLIELMGRKSKALLLFKNRWTTIY